MAIELREAVNIIERGDWFSLRVITADAKTATGGKVLEIPKARIARGHVLNKSVREAQQKAGTRQAKNPNHNLHFTRNIELPNKQLRKIHPILITHINQQPVI